MKVIVLTHGLHDAHGMYTFDGFQKYLNYLANTGWGVHPITLFVIECDKNLNNKWDSAWENNEFKREIVCYANSDGKYHWCLNGKDSHEESMKKIEELMSDEDPKVKQLEAEIATYQKRIEYLENHIKYMPEGEGAIAAKEHFESLAR